MICELVQKQWLTESVCDMTVLCPEMAKKAVPGQFLHILCGGDTYLRRPISICDVIGDRLIRFIFAVRGKGTEALAEHQIGDSLDILGPLGNGFRIQKEFEGERLLIGGGIGVFPLLYLAKKLEGRATVILGFQNRQSVMMTEEFAKVCRNVFVATEDGSVGFHGRVTDVMKNIMQSNPIAGIDTCGPKAMMRQIAYLAKEKDIPVQISMEERMACGVGACMTCTCTVSGSRKRVCKDGPVFDATEVEWND